jgi:hypothetical protein
MLFRNILNEKTQALQIEFDRFINDAHRNQTHPCDLLLVVVNGFYNPDTVNWTNIDPPVSPYMIGPNTEGHSELLHHKFIGKYLAENISEEPLDEYNKKLVWSEEKIKEIDELTEHESYSIQTEMLIYLKIWEADLYLKKWYQLVRLNLGEGYDWHFAILESNRDKEKTGNRDHILRTLIRDRLREKYPIIYATFKNSFITQVRNSIAHSKYSFLGRYIHLNNAIKEDPAAQREVVTFEEWTDIFHDTLVLQTQLNRLLIMADDFYSLLAPKNDLLAEVRINRLHPEIKTEYRLLKHRLEWKDWYWRDNDPD